MKLVAFFLSLLIPLSAFADDAAERPEHYRGLPAPTLALAWQNYNEHNAQLQTLLNKEFLSAGDLDAIHQLTYTLENSLERIQVDLQTLAETLEALHLASESAEREAVCEHGKDYLQQARALRD